MTPLDQLRVAVALGHGAPGAELRLHLDTGETVTVGRGPDAELEHCAMRRVVLAAVDRHPTGPPDVPGSTPLDRCAERVVAFELTGSLQDLGGGVFCHVGATGEQRWLTTLLSPTHTASLLERLDGDTPSVFRARLCPDRDLGVTLVAIEHDDGGRFGDRGDLDAVAADVAAAIYVEELRLGLDAAHACVDDRVTNGPVERRVS